MGCMALMTSIAVQKGPRRTRCLHCEPPKESRIARNTVNVTLA